MNAPVALRVSRSDSAGLDGGRMPAAIKLLKWGPNESTKGQITVNQRTVSELPRNQRARGFETVAIDFDHNSLPGSDTYEKGRAIDIAGYGHPRITPGDGLWIDAIQWTPAGRKFAGSYKDVSPAPGLTDAGEVVFLHSVALTPNGSVYGLELFSAARSDHTSCSSEKAMDWAVKVLVASIPTHLSDLVTRRLGDWRRFKNGPPISPAARQRIDAVGLAAQFGIRRDNSLAHDAMRMLLTVSPDRVVRQVVGQNTVGGFRVNRG